MKVSTLLEPLVILVGDGMLKIKKFKDCSALLIIKIDSRKQKILRFNIYSDPKAICKKLGFDFAQPTVYVG